MPDPSSDTSLSRIFCERAPHMAPAGEADLELALRELVAEGERAWPELRLPGEAFVRHLASCVSGGAPLHALHVADLYLACACATGVRGAVEAFDRAHLSQVGVFLARRRPSPAFVDEVRQVLREKLLVSRPGAAPKVAEYDGKGALGSWVRVVAVRAAIDLRRRAGAALYEARERPDPRTSEPEVGYLKRRYREAFNEAFRGGIAALGAEQRELLRLHFVEGVTLDQLAVELGVHRATVARRIAAIREAILSEARLRLRAALGASEAELESLAGVMRSQIELSLPGLLRPGA